MCCRWRTSSPVSCRPQTCNEGCGSGCSLRKSESSDPILVWPPGFKIPSKSIVPWCIYRTKICNPCLHCDKKVTCGWFHLGHAWPDEFVKFSMLLLDERDWKCRLKFTIFFVRLDPLSLDYLHNYPERFWSYSLYNQSIVRPRDDYLLNRLWLGPWLFCRQKKVRRIKVRL